MPKTLTSSDPRQEKRHNPLTEEYAPSDPFKRKPAKRRKSLKDSEDNEEHYVDSKASRRILQIGRELADEDELERQPKRPIPANTAFSFESRFPGEEEIEEEVGDFDDEAWGDEEGEEVEEIEIDPNDLETFNRFIPSFDDPILRPDDPPSQGTGINLADLILEKIAQHEASTQNRNEGPSADPVDAPPFPTELPPKVIQVYTQTGLLLSRYKSGPLPKPFKILPTLPHWVSLIQLTRPEKWTTNALSAATRLFVSSPKPVVQPFLTHILLPAIRENIYETKKLNVHLYTALKKALYKPAAWFKGLLFPILTSGTATLREAHIISSALARVKVPVLHSAAALYRLCDIAAEQMSGDPEAAGATNVFIRVLLEKKYALPYKVVDALVFHFLRFRAVEQPDDMTDIGTKGFAEGKLPVIWHQTLLAFAQRYRNDITEDQREALLDLVLVRGHKAIGPEVRRELLEGRGRGVVVPEEGQREGGDDTMAMIVD
ncbi:rRNA processing protein-like protein Bystin [Patellaria atrata CBS 101060]|uniref:rRNA processing protein-like protein Bystin n=1 Tax=Patellaria atrata CBS 101060 TaxID=1346257 RepID=A0A9P4SAG4_9PEZI|nr:rRNA processing protein-like protein Bystin [Patellaria atrata CBS 101060]